jgi:hypothetical protein
MPETLRILNVLRILDVPRIPDVLRMLDGRRMKVPRILSAPRMLDVFRTRHLAPWRLLPRTLLTQATRRGQPGGEAAGRLCVEVLPTGHSYQALRVDLALLGQQLTASQLPVGRAPRYPAPPRGRLAAPRGFSRPATPRSASRGRRAWRSPRRAPPPGTRARRCAAAGPRASRPASRRRHRRRAGHRRTRNRPGH